MAARVEGSDQASPKSNAASLVEFEQETAVTLCDEDSAHGELAIPEHRYNKLEERLHTGNGVTSVGFSQSLLQVNEPDTSENEETEPKEKKRIAPDLVLACEPTHPQIVSLNGSRSSSRSSLPGSVKVALPKSSKMAANNDNDDMENKQEQATTTGSTVNQNNKQLKQTLQQQNVSQAHTADNTSSSLHSIVEATNQSASRGDLESIRDSEESDASNQAPGSMIFAPASRKRKHFSPMEDAVILKGVEEHGKNWSVIASSGKLNRNAGQIRKRYRVLERKEHVKPNVRAATEILNRGNSNGALFGSSGVSNSSIPDDTVAQSPQRTGSNRDTAVSSPTPYVRPSNQPVIHNFFLPISSSKGNKEKKTDEATTTATSSKATKPESESAVNDEKGSLLDFRVAKQIPLPVIGPSSDDDASMADQVRETMEVLSTKLKLAEEEVKNLELKLKTTTTQRENTLHMLELQKEECANLSKELERVTLEGRAHRGRAAKVFEKLIREMDKKNNLVDRQQFVEQGFRLGRIVVQKHGVGPRAKLQEVWEDGQSFRALRKKQLLLLQQREELDKRKKQLTRSRARGKSKAANSDAQNQVMGPPTTEVVDENIDLEIMEAEEAVKVQILNFKREEIALAEEKNRLDVEKVMHMRSLKRIRDEDASRFNKHPVLNNRYLLRNLLGKGGFSEVWKAFDLLELKDVAVKIHELNPAWAEIKKSSYLKHATREYKIHLSLVHPRIVQLYDVFEIDSSSFATVLEYCEGTDLDLHLKRSKVLPEREARSLLIQILSGLRYLHAGGEQDNQEEYADDGHGHMPKPPQRRKIIHYDLKPGNILFDENGMVKITDFGLSKIVESDNNSDASAIDLTSQGAGTYWYLPPECFRVGHQPPKISSKVDVWSVGVIFYQMLFGRRPFGEGQSQDKILQNMTMLRATQVEFPDKPVVSKGSREFIRQCLTHDQTQRPDVETLCRSPYLRIKRV